MMLFRVIGYLAIAEAKCPIPVDPSDLIISAPFKWIGDDLVLTREEEAYLPIRIAIPSISTLAPVYNSAQPESASVPAAVDGGALFFEYGGPRMYAPMCLRVPFTSIRKKDTTVIDAEMLVPAVSGTESTIGYLKLVAVRGQVSRSPDATRTLVVLPNSTTLVGAHVAHISKMDGDISVLAVNVPSTVHVSPDAMRTLLVDRLKHAARAARMSVHVVGAYTEAHTKTTAPSRALSRREFSELPDGFVSAPAALHGSATYRDAAVKGSHATSLMRVLRDVDAQEGYPVSSGVDTVAARGDASPAAAAGRVSPAKSVVVTKVDDGGTVRNVVLRGTAATRGKHRHVATEDAPTRQTAALRGVTTVTDGYFVRSDAAQHGRLAAKAKAPARLVRGMPLRGEVDDSIALDLEADGHDTASDVRTKLADAHADKLTAPPAAAVPYGDLYAKYFAPSEERISSDARSARAPAAHGGAADGEIVHVRKGGADTHLAAVASRAAKRRREARERGEGGQPDSSSARQGSADATKRHHALGHEQGSASGHVEAHVGKGVGRRDHGGQPNEAATHAAARRQVLKSILPNGVEAYGDELGFEEIPPESQRAVRRPRADLTSPRYGTGGRLALPGTAGYALRADVKYGGFNGKGAKGFGPAYDPDASLPTEDDAGAPKPVSEYRLSEDAQHVADTIAAKVSAADAARRRREGARGVAKGKPTKATRVLPMEDVAGHTVDADVVHASPAHDAAYSLRSNVELRASGDDFSDRWSARGRAAEAAGIHRQQLRAAQLEQVRSQSPRTAGTEVEPLGDGYASYDVVIVFTTGRAAADRETSSFVRNSAVSLAAVVRDVTAGPFFSWSSRPLLRSPPLTPDATDVPIRLIIGGLSLMVILAAVALIVHRTTAASRTADANDFPLAAPFAGYEPSTEWRAASSALQWGA